MLLELPKDEILSLLNNNEVLTRRVKEGEQLIEERNNS
jgi:hypothetical protein